MQGSSFWMYRPHGWGVQACSGLFGRGRGVSISWRRPFIPNPLVVLVGGLACACWCSLRDRHMRVSGLYVLVGGITEGLLGLKWAPWGFLEGVSMGLGGSLARKSPLGP